MGSSGAVQGTVAAPMTASKLVMVTRSGCRQAMARGAPSFMSVRAQYVSRSTSIVVSVRDTPIWQWRRWRQWRGCVCRVAAWVL
jgi:hypothetical protein